MPKRTKDISGIEEKVLSMYANGMSDRDIAAIVEDIYGCSVSRDTISKIVDRVSLLLGHISLHDIDHLNRNAFLGVMIMETERNKGYGAEAIRLLLKYGFRTLNLNNIMLSVHADNLQAIACYRKVGFKMAGRRRESICKDGEYIDKLYMDILAREFIIQEGATMGTTGIREIIQLYFDASYDGNGEKMAQVLHTGAHIYGRSKEGTLTDTPKDDFIRRVGAPRSPDALSIRA